MNKVLIKLYVPSLNACFDVFIPVNEYVWKINKLFVKSIYDLTEGNFLQDKEYMIVNTETGNAYNPNAVVINTDIRNCTRLSLIQIN